MSEPVSAGSERKDQGRKVLLINREFQLRFLGWIVITIISVLFISYATQMMFFSNLAAEGARIGLPPDHVYFRFLKQQRSMMELSFWGSSILISAVLISLGLYLSNRIAGPLYRLKWYLKARSEGSAKGPLEFRKNDYFKDVAQAVNEYLKQ